MELRHYAGKYIHLLLTDHLRVQLDYEGLAEAVVVLIVLILLTQYRHVPDQKVP